jgi:hypothetical protein
MTNYVNGILIIIVYNWKKNISITNDHDINFNIKNISSIKQFKSYI